MKPKIALVYDRVNTPYGGAEKVLLALHQLYPEAPLFTSVYHPQAKWADVFQIKTSFLQHFPFAKKHHRIYAPLMPLAFESFDLDEFDIIISITSAEAKGVITKPHQLHLCYLLTPTRYLYSHRHQYEATNWPFKVPLLSFFSRKLLDYLTWWDQVAATRPDVIIPISNLVAHRTQHYYQRQPAPVIYPPLDPDQLQPLPDIHLYHQYYLPEKYLLIVSRLVPYKQLKEAIQAAQKLNYPVVVIGSGPAEKELNQLATAQTFFLGNVNQTQLHSILSQADALLMPGLEDFGITALEAIYAGVPVILHQDSGVAELLPSGVIKLTDVTVESIAAAIEKLSVLETDFSSLQKNIEKYAINNFTKRFREAVLSFWKGDYESS